MNMHLSGRTGKLFYGIVTLVMLVVWAAAGPSRADEAACREKKPARLIRMAVEYPGVVVPLGDDVSMDVIFTNKGRSDEDLDVRVAQAPPRWKVRLKTYRYTVTGVHVASGEEKRITFEAHPSKQVTPGDYLFLVAARTPDGKFKFRRRIQVTVRRKSTGNDEVKGIKLTTSYPVLRGPSDAKFEFSLDVESKLDKDAIFDLFAKGPEGWEINFKPAYESKYISSLRLKAGQSSSVAVEVKPPPQAPAREYPLHIRVSSGDARAEATLKVVLTGTYALDVGTPNGLLSLDAHQGIPANLSFYVKNTGSAANNNIKFLSFKPENWQVTFKPQKITTLKPGELKQVELSITPYSEALVGDYAVNVRVAGEKVEKPLEFRVTVKASSAWGWIGIGIILAVVGGLTVLFRKLGRR